MSDGSTLTSSPAVDAWRFQESLLRSFCFIATAIRLMPIRSYVRSTDFHRKPCGEYVFGCVHIPIMASPALRAIPSADIERQLFNDMSTMATSLRTRKPTVNLDKSATIPIALIFKLSNQFTPASITDSSRQFLILDHVLHSQILNGDGLVFTHQSSRQLVNKIFSGIGNLYDALERL